MEGLNKNAVPPAESQVASELGRNVKDKDTSVECIEASNSSLRNLLVYGSGDEGSNTDSDEEECKVVCDVGIEDNGEEEEEEDNDDDVAVGDESSSESEVESNEVVAVEKTPSAHYNKSRPTPQSNMIEILKSMGELTLDELPPVPDVKSMNVKVEEGECEEMGKISSIIDKLVMVESIHGKPAYDVETLLFLDRGKLPLGYIFDVIGPVTSPLYAIRFNSVEDIKKLDISVGLPVFAAPKSVHTQYVFVQALLRAKGSDASWKNDAEVPREYEDFSDDDIETRSSGLPLRRKRNNSVERNRKFEDELNTKNRNDTRLHKIRDNFDRNQRMPQSSNANTPHSNSLFRFNRPPLQHVQMPPQATAFPPPFTVPVPFPPPTYIPPQNFNYPPPPVRFPMPVYYVPAPTPPPPPPQQTKNPPTGPPTYQPCLPNFYPNAPPNFDASMPMWSPCVPPARYPPPPRNPYYNNQN